MPARPVSSTRPTWRIIRLMCSGRVDLTFVLKALSLGADGVLIAGCHLGECHYIQQNYKTIRRFTMLRHTLRTLESMIAGVQSARGLLLARQPIWPSFLWQTRG